VWDSSPNPNVRAFIKVDTTIGDRCFFANPVCTVKVTTFPSGGGISTALWGSDTAVPAAIQAL
jgi:hypothetical protein